MDLGKLSHLLNSHKNQPFSSKAYDPARPTVFVHMLKTAGTALTRGLTAAIAPRAAVYGIDRALFGDFEGFESIDPELRRWIHLDSTSLPPDADFIAGHMSFSTLVQRYQTAQSITILREPFSRILSHWLYWRAQPDDEIRRWGDWAERVYKSKGLLIDFLSCRGIACQVDNLYVRMLLWPHRLIPNNDFIDERDDYALVNEATARLNRFAYIDVVENPGLRENLQAWLGRPFDYTSANETPRIPSALRAPLHSELKCEVLDLLERRARLDLKLWTAVARYRVSRLTPDSLRARAVLLNAARHSWLLTNYTG